MSNRIADAFVSVLAPGVTLRAWRDMGVADRNAPMYQAMRAHYQRVIVVSDDVPGQGERVLGDGVQVVGVGGDAEGFGRVIEALADSSNVVVRTDELAAGVRAVALTRALDAVGIRRSLIARGGHLWSRFAAHESGADSSEARQAAVCESTLMREADVVMATTRAMGLDLEWRYQLASSDVCIVPNYVLTDLSPPSSSHRQKGLILSAGELIPRKRFDMLVRAVARLPESIRTSVRLMLAGNGPERANLESLAKELGVTVEFMPAMRHADLLDLMRRVCIYACSSEFEGHPRCVLEAMHARAAVVVADSPGLSTAVQNGVTGVKVQGDPEAFAYAIGALMDDDDWRVLLGDAANGAVQAEFSFERVLGLEIDAHRLAVERAGRRRRAA